MASKKVNKKRSKKRGQGRSTPPPVDKSIYAFLTLFLFFIFAFIGLLQIEGFTGLAVFNTTDQDSFDTGNYSSTFYNATSTAVELNTTDNLTGNYTSKIFDAGGSSNWTNISWVSSAIGELPADARNEIGNNDWGSGGINMTGNVLYYRFNNDTSVGENSTHVYDYSGEENNGTWTNGGQSNETGKLGKHSGTFDGDDDYIELGTIATGEPLQLADTQFTIMAWVKQYDNDGAQRIIDKSDGGSAANGWTFYIDDSAVENDLGIAVDGNICYTPANQYTDATWTFVAVIANGSEYIFYSNLNRITGCTFAAGSYAEPPNAATNARVGSWNHATAREFNGNLDELAVWNRSLSADEISNIYKRGVTRLNLTARTCDDSGCVGETFVDINDSLVESLNTTQDLVSYGFDENRYFQYQFEYETENENLTSQLYNVTISYDQINFAPNLTYNNPANGSFINVNYTLLNVTVSDIDPDGPDNTTVYFFGNGSLINTTYNNTNGTNVTYNWTDLTDGNYNWTAVAEDEALNSTNVTQYFTIDTTNPTIDYVDFSTNASNVSQTWIFVNVSGTDTNLDTINITLYNGSLDVINTSTNTTSPHWFNFTGLSDGNYSVNITVNDSANNSNVSVTRYIGLDTVNPTINEVNYVPNTTQHWDPNVNVSYNVTFADVGTGINTVVLQYYNGSDWANQSFASINGSIYDANLSLQPGATNYTFNVRIEDFAGNANETTNTTIASAYDCTWDATPTALGATNGFDQTATLGNITINNTGDAGWANNNCTISFRLTHDLTQGRILFDGSSVKPSNTFDITAGSNKTIEVDATFLTEVNEEAVVITVSDALSYSENATSNTTATIVSTQGGPYLFQSLETVPSTIELRDGNNVSLSASIRNLAGDDTNGNTSFNVSFNWSLPSDFTLDTGGNSTLKYQNLSNSTVQNNDINLVFDSVNLPELGPGEITVSVLSQGYNITGDIINHSSGRIILNESTNITLSCYGTSDGITIDACGSLDGDYVESTTTTTTTTTTSSSGGGGSAGGGGGGGSTGLSIEQREKLFQTKETYELVRGESDSFKLKIENPFSDVSLEDVKISVSGFLAQYLTVEPNTIPIIPLGLNVEVDIIINAPKYFTEGIHDLTFTITGLTKEEEISVSGTKIVTTEIQEKKIVTLFIHEITEEKATGFLSDAAALINEMEEAGLNILAIQEIYNEASRDFNAKKFGSVKKISELIELKKEQAFKTLVILEDVQKDIDFAQFSGLKVSKTERLLLLSSSSLNRGDYETALKRAQDAQTTFALETIGKFNPIRFVINNWPGVAAGSAGAGIIGFASLLGLRYFYFLRRLRSLRKEEDVLLGLIKQTQKECFTDGKLNMKEYNDSLLQYEERLSKVVQNTIKFETKKKGISKIFKGQKNHLDEEEKKIQNLIKETQKAYLEAGKLETRVYRQRMRSYSERLTEIVEARATLSARRAGVK
jgi:archaellum component FlaC